MTLTRYQIRNEYGLAEKELYQSSDKEDAEVLLEGSSMAGLVGLLRQLGDLAEFAGEVFHCLHEELMTTAARGKGLAIRLQHLEAEVPNVVESQTDHSTFFYHPGLEWHSNLKTEENLISPRKLPHCIVYSYEECRGPPQLYLLDKFDVDGSGSCLKRYSDPSLLKTEVLETSKLSKDETQSKTKKKESHMSKEDKLGDSKASHAKLHQLFLVEHVEKGQNNPEYHVKLKRRHQNGPLINNSSSGTGYMEKFLKISLPNCERVDDTLDKSSSATETEVTACNVRVDLSTPSLVYPSTRKEREMELIADDERPYLEGGAMVCLERSSSVNFCGRDAPASTETEPKDSDGDDKIDGNADVTQTEFMSSNVLYHTTEEGEYSLLNASEGGTKDLLQTNDAEDEHSQNVFSVETESEMSLTGLVEDQFSSLINQESEKESLIQNQHISTFEDIISVDVVAGHESAFPEEVDTNSQVGNLMLDTGNMNPSCQEDTIANSDQAEISSDCQQEDPQTMSGDNQTRLNDKASETIDLDCLLSTQECFSAEYYIQTHGQGQESSPETESENPTVVAATESLPPRDVQCSASEEVEAPQKGTITSSIESVLPMNPTDQENCLDVSMSPFSNTSLHETTPPLPPLPPTQWWMGKLVETVKTTEEEEQSPSESVAWESLLTPEAESTQGLEALEWFSQNLKEHTIPNLTKLQEEPQHYHPLETQGDNNSYQQNENVEKLPRDKGSLSIGIDKSMLRKVSERNRTQLGARVEENDSLLEIIRSKSFNLKPADASVRHNFQVAVPITNLKVAAILEKANSLRHAMAGSDDDHDSDSWSE